MIDTFFKRREKNAVEMTLQKLAKYYLERIEEAALEMRRIGVFHYSLSELRQTTPMARDVVWKKFIEEVESSSVVLYRFKSQQLDDLKVLKDSNVAGGDKGYRFESLFVRHFMLNNTVTAFYSGISHDRESHNVNCPHDYKKIQRNLYCLL